MLISIEKNMVYNYNSYMFKGGKMKKRFENLTYNNHTGYLISNESNVSYLSGFMGEASYLILAEHKRVLMTDGRYDEAARQTCGEDFEVTKWHHPKRPDPDTIIHYVKELGIKQLMFNGQDLSYNNHLQIQNALKHHQIECELIPMDMSISNMRMVKDESEIEKIRQACAIGDQALEALIPHIKVGVTELELVGYLELYLKKYGAEDRSFETIILSGEKTALPHGKPTDKKLAVGDFLQVDFGALYKGYHSDMSRTFIIGQAHEKQVKLYRTMLEATIQATEALTDDISAKVPDEAVRQLLGQEYLDYYYPGLGHGVGLDIHERPFMSQSSHETLKENQVVTIEPGVYIPGWGGMRIEDTILITKNGYEVLTKFPRELQVLDKQ